MSRSAETPSAARPPLTPLQPVYTVHLMPGLHAELIALLEGLAPDDWTRPTLAPAWRVRDVTAHLLDVILRRVAGTRDDYRLPPDQPIDSYPALVQFLNRLNHDWVAASQRLSPRVLIDLLALAGPQAAAALATLDPEADAAIPVAWAGETVSRHWFSIGREYTEWWHHQAQIRDAVGAPPLNGRAWLHPLIALSLRALPHAYRAVEASEGTTIAISIEGEAGGVWCLHRRDLPASAAVDTVDAPAAADDTGGASGATDAGRTDAADPGQAPDAPSPWELFDGDLPSPTARLCLDADTAWRLLFNALPPDEARRLVRMEGDARLGEPLLATRSVMV